MNEKSPRLGIVGATLLAPLLWGTTYLTVTEFLPAGRPMLVAWLRVLPAGLLLAGFGLVRHRWWPHGREWRELAVLGLFNFGIFFPLLIAAVYRLPGGVAAAVGGVQPLLVGGLTWACGGQRLNRRDVAVGLVAVIGVAMVVIRPNAAVDSVGVLAALGANVSFAIGVVLTRRLQAPAHRVPSVGWQLLLSSIVIGVMGFAVEGAMPHLTGRNVVGFAYLGLIATGLAFALWFNGIRRLPIQAPPLLGLAGPITGATLGWMVKDQALTPVQLLGFAVTVAAICYGALLGARDARPTPDAGNLAGRFDAAATNSRS